MNTININDIGTCEQLLSSDTFQLLLNTKGHVEKAHLEIDLTQKAKELGIEPQFKKLLRAYQKEGASHEAGSAEKPLTTKDIMSKFHRYNKDGQPIGVKDKAICMHILETYHIFVISGIPYIYDNGVYRVDENETRLKAIIQKLIYDDIVSIDIINRIYRLIIAQETLQRSYEDINNFPRHWINFKNGLMIIYKAQILANKIQ